MRPPLSLRLFIWAPIALLATVAWAQWLQWSSWRYELQKQVDDVAGSAVAARERGEDPLARARDEIAAYDLSGAAIVEYPPQGGLFAGDPDALRVRASVVRRPFLAPLIGETRLSAAATAAAFPSHKPGVRRTHRVE